MPVVSPDGDASEKRPLKTEMSVDGYQFRAAFQSNQTGLVPIWILLESSFQAVCTQKGYVGSSIQKFPKVLAPWTAHVWKFPGKPGVWMDTGPKVDGSCSLQ